MEINKDMGDFKLVYERRVEYAPQQEQATAVQSMKDLEAALPRLGFEPMMQRQTSWDGSLYARIMGKDGAYVLLEAYFDGKGESARTQQTVCYNITGLERDVDATIAQIERIKSGQPAVEGPRCMTCR